MHKKTTSKTQNRINKNNSGRKSASGGFLFLVPVVLLDDVVDLFCVPLLDRVLVFFFVDADELLLLRPFAADAKTSFLLNTNQ